MRVKPIVSTDTVRWAARQVVRMHIEPATDHRATGACAQCPPDGACPLLTWAQAIIPAAEQDGWFVEREDPEHGYEEFAGDSGKAGRGDTVPGHEGYPLGGRFRPHRRP